MKKTINIFLKRLTLIALLFVPLHLNCKRPLNLTIAKQDVDKYHTSGRFNKDLKKIIGRALRHFKNVRPCNKQTVIFDIDDTTLSNFADEKSIAFGYIPKLFHKWILEADAPAIPEVKELYDFLVRQGFTIVFLTGRKYNEYDATIKNLKREGFTTFDKLIVRQSHELDMTAQDYKTNRRKELTEQGYNIVGTIGDQWSDLNGKYAGYRVKVPNYRYMIP